MDEETIDGNNTLSQTESAIQLKESNAFEMKELAMGEANPPTNKAKFEGVGDIPADFHLTKGAIPAGKKEVWSGTIYVKGKQTQAKGYRD